MIEPLTPPDCDLRDFAFMPLDVVRLRDSDLAAIESAEVFRAAVLLWCASWHQVPAGSIPKDDRVLSNLAGFGRVVKEWLKIKEGALRGWVECSDGRLYHKVVCEKALESHESKLRHAYNKMAERLRKMNKARADKGLSPVAQPTYADWISSGMTEPVPPEETRNSAGSVKSSSVIPPEKPLKGTEHKGQGTEHKGQGTEHKGQGDSIKPVDAAAAPPPQTEHPETELQAASRAVWKSYSTAFFDRYGTEPVQNAKVRSQIKQFVQRIGFDESPQVAAHFLQSNLAYYVQRGHVVDCLLADAEKLRTEWATGRSMTATRARQLDQTAANAGVADEAMRILEQQGVVV